MSATAAVISVRDAIVAAIMADPTLMGMLAGDKVYLRQAEPNSPLPYVVLGPVSERDGSRFMQPGHAGLETPTCWGREIGEADRVYVELRRVLHNQRLVLNGHLMRRKGKLIRLTDHPDPEVTAHGVFCSYRVESRVAA